MTDLSLPEGITSIGAYTLEGCSGIASLRIPDSVTDISAGALRSMSSLETLTLGSGTAILGAGALDGCSALKNIYVAAGNTRFESVDGVLYYADRAGLARYPAGAERESYALDSSSMLIEGGAFAGAKKLQTLTLPDGLVQVGDGAFRNCSALSELDIPDTVVSIGDGAFPGEMTLLVGAESEALHYSQANGLVYRIRGQEDVNVPAVSISALKDSLTLQKGRIYTLSVTLEPVNTTDTLQWFSADPATLRVDDGIIRPLHAGETEITAVAGEAELVIPITVTDSALWINEPTALLYEGDSLQLTVSLADNVPAETVSWYSDTANVSADGVLSPRATGIATVTAALPDGSMAEASEICVMNDGTLKLPGMLQAVEEEAFQGSASIRAVVLPEGMTAVGGNAFADCAELRIAVIPDSVTDISDSAFAGSPNVTIVCREGSTAAAYAEEGGTVCQTVDSLDGR